MTAPEFATATEREALCGFLDLQRAVLIRKVQGITDADARTSPTASSLSLLGLLKHSALWERRWFQNIVAGRSFPGEFPELEVSEDEMDAEDFRVDERDTVEHWVASFNEQAGISRQITAERDLDTPCAWPPLAHRNLRWVLLHMIEEPARRADLTFAPGLVTQLIDDAMRLVGLVMIGIIVLFLLTPWVGLWNQMHLVNVQPAFVGQLFGVALYDPLTLCGVCAVLALVALLAAVLPTFRIASIDPAETLRAQ